MSGNMFFKSIAWVMGLTRSFSDILTLLNHLIQRKHVICPYPSIFHIYSKDHRDSHWKRFLCPQESLIQSDSVGPKDLRSFLTRRIWRLSFLLLNLAKALLLSFRQGHALISFPSTCTSSLPKTLETLTSNKSLGIEIGIPTTSKHSHLEYCALVQHCHAVSISWLTSFWFIFMTIISLDFFQLFFLFPLMSEFISDSSCNTSLIKSGLFKPCEQLQKNISKNRKNTLLARHKVVKTYFISSVV